MIDASPSSSVPYVIPPPIPEQKRLRRLDQSIVPPAPYLLASHLLDIACFSVPVAGQSVCPPPEAGGWRSALPREWTNFPHGPLSHSFEGYLMEDDLKGDLKTLEEHKAEWEAGRASARVNGGADYRGAAADALARYHDFAFDTDSTVLADLSQPSALVVILFLVLVLRFVHRVAISRFEVLGRCLGRRAHGKVWVQDNADRISKFGEELYRLCWHFAVSIYGLWLFASDPLMSQRGTSSLWNEYPNHPDKPGMVWFYLVMAAFNVQELANLVELSFTIEWVNPLAQTSASDSLERKRAIEGCYQQERTFNETTGPCSRSVLRSPFFELKWSNEVQRDFTAMMAHHVVTNAAIFLSSWARFTRVGSAVALVHYLPDIFINLFKLAKFVKLKTATTVFFVLTVLIWAAARLYVFPCIIWRSVMSECREYLVERGTMDPALYDAYIPLANGLGWALILLSVTWFLLLLRVGRKLVSTGESRDYTECKVVEKQKDVCQHVAGMSGTYGHEVVADAGRGQQT
ncbi:hypothetical protein ACHAWF_007060 [Thalassiosira exigua]